MLLESLDAAREYAHIYIAPHLDDAVLSCGGQIAQHTATGARVLVVTICAGSPKAGAALTPMPSISSAPMGLAPTRPPGAARKTRTP